MPEDFVFQKIPGYSCNFMKIQVFGCFIFIFCSFTDKNWQVQVFETGPVGLVEIQLFSFMPKNEELKIMIQSYLISQNYPQASHSQLQHYQNYDDDHILQQK